MNGIKEFRAYTIPEYQVQTTELRTKLYHFAMGKEARGCILCLLYAFIWHSHSKMYAYIISLFVPMKLKYVYTNTPNI